MVRLTPERWQQVAEIADVALDLPPEERPAYLARACGDDASLRSDLDDLLAADAASGDFLEAPAAEFLTSIAGDQEAGRGHGRSPPERGSARIGSVRELAHGGMGVVYLAERADGQFEQRVALKLIKRGMDSDEILRRFLAERQVLARLSHPHIAACWTAASRPRGGRGSPWSTWRASRSTGTASDTPARRSTSGSALFRKVCEAVQYAHQNLVVHRDLKPSNILVTDGRRDEAARLRHRQAAGSEEPPTRR